MAVGRRRRLLPWIRRWRTSLWCCACLLLLGLLALRDALPHYIMPDTTENSRVCVPTTAEMDGCMSWRPLVLRHPTCRCLRPLHALHDTCVEVEAHDPASYLTYTSTFHGNSTCSAAATLRGPNQLVLAISAVINSQSQAQLLEAAARQAQDLYRGWTLRLYTSASRSDLNLVCPVVCNFPDIDLCGVEKAGVEDLAAAEPWGWKWAVMGDPLVSVWETRKLDEALQMRDAHATTQFANAPQCWHIMRDHTGHMRTVGSGMVGGKGSWGLQEATKLRRQLLSSATTKGNKKEPEGTTDSKMEESNDVEVILGEQLGSADTMMHDSIACTSSGGAAAVPFPSMRPPGTWVGMPQTLTKEDIESISRTAPSAGLFAAVEKRHDFKNRVEESFPNHLDSYRGSHNQARNKDANVKTFGDIFSKSAKVNHVRNNRYQSPLFRSLDIQGWKNSETRKNWTLKTGDDSSRNKWKIIYTKEEAKTNLEKNMTNDSLHSRKNSLHLTIIKVPNDMPKSSGNNTDKSNLNSSAAGSLKEAPKPSEHLRGNISSHEKEDSLVLDNDRRDSKTLNVSSAKQRRTLESYSVPSNATQISRPPQRVSNSNGSQSKLSEQTGSRNDTIMYKTKEDSHDNPKVVLKISDKPLGWPSTSDDNHDPEGNQASRKTSKSKRSADPLTEFKTLYDLHQELGIPLCPEACRPFLHPDWEYC